MRLLSTLKVNLLNLIRNKMTLFWNTFFPIILATFFCLIIPKIGTSFDKVNVGIDKNNSNIHLLKKISYLNLKEVKKDVLQDLKNKEYKAFIDDDLSIKTIYSDSDVMIVKNILNQVKQIYETKIDHNEIIKNITKDFIEDKNQNMSGVETILFSILIMTSLYTMFDGVVYMDSILYDSSDFAVRMLISPIKKSVYLINGIISAIIINGFNILIFLLYLKFVFKISLITNYILSAFIIITIMIFAIIVGMFFSVILKTKTETKSMIALGFILLMNYTSGMIGTAATNKIVENFPIINKINPAIYMENALLSANIANDGYYFIEMIKYIIPFSLVIFAITLIRFRRHKI